MSFYGNKTTVNNSYVELLNIINNSIENINGNNITWVKAEKNYPNLIFTHGQPNIQTNEILIQIPNSSLYQIQNGNNITNNNYWQFGNGLRLAQPIFSQYGHFVGADIKEVKLPQLSADTSLSISSTFNKVTIKHNSITRSDTTTDPYYFQFNSGTRFTFVNEVVTDTQGHCLGVKKCHMVVPSLSDLIPFLGQPASNSSFNSLPLFNILGENHYTTITTSQGNPASALWYHSNNTLIDTIGDPYRFVEDGTSRPHTIRMQPIYDLLYELIYNVNAIGATLDGTDSSSNTSQTGKVTGTTPIAIGGDLISGTGDDGPIAELPSPVVPGIPEVATAGSKLFTDVSAMNDRVGALETSLLNLTNINNLASVNNLLVRVKNLEDTIIQPEWDDKNDSFINVNKIDKLEQTAEYLTSTTAVTKTISSSQTEQVQLKDAFLDLSEKYEILRKVLIDASNFSEAQRGLGNAKAGDYRSSTSSLGGN